MTDKENICDCGSGLPANRGHGSACNSCIEDEIDNPEIETKSGVLATPEVLSVLEKTKRDTSKVN